MAEQREGLLLYEELTEMLLRLEVIIGFKIGSSPAIMELKESTAKAQLAKVLKHRLDRSKLREKIRNVLDMAECFGRFSADVVWKEGKEEAEEGYIDLILALIPDEEEIRAKLNAEIRIELGSRAFEKAKKQERERIRKGMAEAFDVLFKIPVPDFIPRDMLVKVYDEIIKLALKGGSNGNQAETGDTTEAGHQEPD